MRVLIQYRFVLSLALSGVIGVIALRLWPFPAENVFLGLISLRRPVRYAALAYTYATLWFSTPWLLLNVAFSLIYSSQQRWYRLDITVTLNHGRDSSEHRVPLARRRE